jgi:hypothetical protein
MKRIAFALTILVACSVAFALGHRWEVHHLEELTAADVLGTASDFDYAVLRRVDSNQLAAAKNMLEEGIFMDLQQIWANRRENGEFVDDLTRQRFLKLYPPIRHRVALARFVSLPARVQQELSTFVKEADAYVGRHPSSNVPDVQLQTNEKNVDK